jgi:hypothetical protein
VADENFSALCAKDYLVNKNSYLIRLRLASTFSFLGGGFAQPYVETMCAAERFSCNPPKLPLLLSFSDGFTYISEACCSRLVLLQKHSPKTHFKKNCIEPLKMTDHSVDQHCQGRESPTQGGHRHDRGSLENDGTGLESNKSEGGHRSYSAEFQPTLSMPPADCTDQRQTDSSPLNLRDTDRPYYEYQQFADASSIRLIELQPGIGDSVLRIAIYASPYPPTQNYEALSYT